MTITRDQIQTIAAGQAAAHRGGLHRVAHLLRVIGEIGAATLDGDDLALALSDDGPDGVIARAAAFADELTRGAAAVEFTERQIATEQGRGHALRVVE